MRITSSMYYKGIYGNNNSKLSKELFDVNKQIASGLKIQYAKDDVRTFTETMRLDNEIAILGQVKKSTQSASKFSNQSDVVLNEFNTSMNRTKTLLIQAANGTNDSVSLDAIAQELRGIEKNFKILANTSINGQYLFAGSATDTKPITESGEYVGNSTELKSFSGSGISQQYNISGAELFLGDDNTNVRNITTNVVQKSNESPDLDLDTTMQEYNGTLPGSNKHHFYLRGSRSDGTSFKKDISLENTSTMQNLLDAIGTEYGNTGGIDVVNVTMNDSGQIVVEDKLNGSSKLDFHMVGASDFNTTDRLTSITDIDFLDNGTTDYAIAKTGSKVFIREFIKSGFSSASSTASNIKGIVYDRTNFTKDGSTLTSNIPQILKKTHYIKDKNAIIDTIPSEKENSFANPSTLLSEVANTKTEITPPTEPKTYTMEGTKFILSGTDVSDSTFSVKIELSALPGGATFSVGATTYNIYNVDGSSVQADKMTYQQLMDVMNMVTTGELPASAPGTQDEYDIAIGKSLDKGRTSLSYDGKIQFKDSNHGATKAKIAIYDENSGDFSKDASVMTFNSNNSLTVRDPKTDFFKTLDDVITSVENYKSYPDASSGNMRNVGIENAIAMIDDLQDHVARSQSKVGAQSNSLSKSLERVEILEVSSKTLRSSVVDTDLAEASLSLAQLQINYEAMLSTVGKVSKLSLVNYL